MRKPIVAMLSAVVAIAGSALLAAPASAASSVTADFADAVMSAECAGVPVKLTVIGASPAVRYEASVVLHDPDGFRDEAGTDPDGGYPPTVVAGSVPPAEAPSVKTVTPEVCGFESPGVWRADVKVDYFNNADDLIETKTATDTATLRRATSYTGLARGSVNRKLVIAVNAEAPGGVEPCQFCETRLQQRKHGKWKTIEVGFTGKLGQYRTDVRPKRHVSYRAVTPESSTTRSVSEVFRRR